MIDIIVIIGLIAAALTTMASLPQAIKAWKTKSTNDISLTMYFMLCTGIILWFIYGLLIASLPLILANGFALIINGSILILKIKYK